MARRMKRSVVSGSLTPRPLARRARQVALDHAANLRQLVHEVRLRVQPAGGVDDERVHAPGGGGLDRIEHDGTGIGTGGLVDYLDLDALPPALELLDRRGAKGVGGREKDLLPRALQ